MLLLLVATWTLHASPVVDIQVRSLPEDDMEDQELVGQLEKQDDCAELDQPGQCSELGQYEGAPLKAGSV